MIQSGTGFDVNSPCEASLEPNVTGKQQPLGMAWQGDSVLTDVSQYSRCTTCLPDNSLRTHFLYLSLLQDVCVCESVVMHGPQHACGDQETHFQSQFSPFTIGSWNGIHNPVHIACTYTHGAHLQHFKTLCKRNAMFYSIPLLSIYCSLLGMPF